MTDEQIKRTPAAILADVRRLAREYYAVTGRPLGITGEVAECHAAQLLGLALAGAREPGFDAIRVSAGVEERIQIKGRRQSRGTPYRGRVPKIDLRQPFDHVMLVLLDEHYEVFEILEAPREKVVQRLSAPGSRARNERGSLGISQFKSISTRIWPTASSSAKDAPT